MRHRIPPRSGAALRLHEGQRLKIIDVEGEQVSDLVAFNATDAREWISSGRTLDYLSRLLLTKGDAVWSNRSNVLFEIVEDTVGRHDFLLAPCSAEMFRKVYGDVTPHQGCFGNLCAALAPHGIHPDDIPVAFNVFMNVEIDGGTGALSVRPPKSKAGDYLTIEARMDLLVGLTACSALQSNNYAFKPIEFEIFDN
jgi:uncharacterized protein YcgI (DUF1989 family)